MINRALTIILTFLTLSAWAQKPLTELPFRLHGNYILVDVHVNRSEPLEFIFDIAAMETIITAKVAQDLGLTELDQRRVLTASEIRTLKVVPGQNILFGTIPFRNLTLLIDDHSLEEFNKGDKIKGILGYPVLSNYVVEIDYDQRVIRLFDPTVYAYSGPGAEVEFSLMYNVPKVNAQIGINDTTTLYGEFLLDTGSDYALVLTNQFVKKNGLLKKLGPHYNIETRRRPKTGYTHTRISGINFGNHFLPDISVVYYQGSGGLLGFKTFDGIIGNEILKRFNIVYDHINARLFLEPNDKFDQEFPFDCSGLVLAYHWENDRITVTEVLPASPAAEVGIRKGDVLKAVNFEPVFNFDLVEIKEMFTQYGEEMDLEIERNGRIIQKKLVLETFIQ